MHFPIHHQAELTDEATYPFTWLTAKVTAIMDHCPPNVKVGSIVEDETITTYLGDTVPATKEDPATGNWADLNTYPLTRSFTINYRGISSQQGQNGLQYDSHQGYDYPFPSNRYVYAVGDGEIAVQSDFTSQRELPAGLAVSNIMNQYHGLVVLHKKNGAYTGYCTVYMHMDWIDPSCVDTNDLQNWKPRKSAVSANMRIGRVGRFDKHADNWQGSFHLHFAVWMKNLDGVWIGVDPYGTQALDGSQISPALWINE